MQTSEATKQVIVLRKDLNMRKGKMVAQGAHASLSFITKPIQQHLLERKPEEFFGQSLASRFGAHQVAVNLTVEEAQWITSSFTKITLGCADEVELLQLYWLAKQANLTVHLVTDNGVTEFGNVPTNTAICIGPHYNHKIDPITGHLKPL